MVERGPEKSTVSGERETCQNGPFFLSSVQGIVKSNHEIMSSKSKKSTQEKNYKWNHPKEEQDEITSTIERTTKPKEKHRDRERDQVTSLPELKRQQVSEKVEKKLSSKTRSSSSHGHKKDKFATLLDRIPEDTTTTEPSSSSRRRRHRRPGCDGCGGDDSVSCTPDEPSTCTETCETPCEPCEECCEGPPGPPGCRGPRGQNGDSSPYAQISPFNSGTLVIPAAATLPVNYILGPSGEAVLLTGINDVFDYQRRSWVVPQNAKVRQIVTNISTLINSALSTTSLNFIVTTFLDRSPSTFGVPLTPIYAAEITDPNPISVVNNPVGTTIAESFTAGPYDNVLLDQGDNIAIRVQIAFPGALPLGIADRAAISFAISTTLFLTYECSQ